ncbi:hypothetical protein PSHT_06036 [Puccinia striiformis]|uniref:Uncharacterized protein n=1 Tax=Puccinia striiformis TaxID=27350 RepID=A0A2S4W8Z4_9BASI|nr:hypothetical protein PSHT_06036 [Puccinia striiformis]
MNALPSVGRRITTLNALKIPHTLKRAECPYCCSKIVGQQEEWMYIILDCDTFKDTRARTIQPTIEYLLERVAGTGITAKRHVLNKDPTNDDHYLETAYGEEDLCQWVNGYRHIPDLYPNKLLGGHGYANVVRFLQGTVPKVTRILYDVGTAVITDDFEGFANDEGNTGNKAAVLSTRQRLTVCQSPTLLAVLDDRGGYLPGENPVWWVFGSDAPKYSSTLLAVLPIFCSPFLKLCAELHRVNKFFHLWNSCFCPMPLRMGRGHDPVKKKKKKRGVSVKLWVLEGDWKPPPPCSRADKSICFHTFPETAEFGGFENSIKIFLDGLLIVKKQLSNVIR